MSRLASAYLGVRTESRKSIDPVRMAQLELELVDVVTRARAVHPKLAVDDLAFVEFIASRTAVHHARLDIGDAHLGDLYLACAAATGVPGAVELLEQQCIAQIPRAITRIDRSPMFVTEIQQRIREKLIVGARPRIAEYGARGSLGAFIRVAAIREALMEKRATGRERAETLDEIDGIVEGDATLEMVRREYHAEFQQALRDALAKLDRHERAALRMSYLDQLSIDQIGKLFQVHRATAARWILRGQERVRSMTRATLQQRLLISDSEVDSLLHDLMSGDVLSSGMLASSIRSRPAA